MAGGLMSLVAYGAQDIYLVGKLKKLNIIKNINNDKFFIKLYRSNNNNFKIPDNFPKDKNYYIMKAIKNFSNRYKYYLKSYKLGFNSFNEKDQYILDLMIENENLKKELKKL